MTRISNAPPGPPTPTPDDYARIANAIHAISDVGKRLNSSGLSRRAIVVLLQDLTGLRQGDIKLILDALPQMSKYYLSQAAAPAKRS